MSYIDDLVKIKELFDAGVLSQKEFDNCKKKILKSSHAEANSASTKNKVSDKNTTIEVTEESADEITGKSSDEITKESTDETSDKLADKASDGAADKATVDATDNIEVDAADATDIKDSYEANKANYQEPRYLSQPSTPPNVQPNYYQGQPYAVGYDFNYKPIQKMYDQTPQNYNQEQFYQPQQNASTMQNAQSAQVAANEPNTQSAQVAANEPNAQSAQVATNEPNTQSAQVVTAEQNIQPNQNYGNAQIQFHEPRQRSRVAAGMFGIFLGCFGAHNFYLGFTTKGIIQLLITLLLSFPFLIGFFVAGIWALIEAILILVGYIPADSNGVPLKD